MGKTENRNRRTPDVRAAGHPEWVAPMLATLTSRRFSDPDWIFERKLDGERCLGFREGGRVRLLSRSKQDLNGTYPEIVGSLADQAPQDFVVDGEIVAFEGAGTSFSRLQQRMGITDPDAARRSPVSVYYYLFDLMHLEGYDVTRLGLRERKGLLRRAIRFSDPLRYTIHRNAEGEAAFEQACQRGWEGLVAKRADAPYTGGRSQSWLKMKCSAGQEVVIGGYTEPSGSRTGIGALLVGYYDRGELVYAGKVGTGFTHAVLVDLKQRLSRIETASSPFGSSPFGSSPFSRGRPAGRGTHWARPELVAEVAFTEWTADGRMRHPSFKGLREDKPARDVVRERSPAGAGRG